MVRMISPIVKRGAKVKTGKGFSIDEVKEAGVNVGEARHLGVPVDPRRSTSYPENVEALKEWIAEARKEGLRVLKPKQTAKGQKGRAFRALHSPQTLFSSYPWISLYHILRNIAVYLINGTPYRNKPQKQSHNEY